jgi:hypothetical protein
VSSYTLDYWHPFFIGSFAFLFNNDGKQIHQLINIKTNNHFSLQLIEKKKRKKKAATYDVGNPGPGLGQAQHMM